MLSFLHDVISKATLASELTSCQAVQILSGFLLRGEKRSFSTGKESGVSEVNAMGSVSGILMLDHWEKCWITLAPAN